MREQGLLDRAQTMRKQPTEPEYRLWLALRAGRLDGAKFRRQQVIGSYIADFACRLPCKIIVEADGESHAEQAGYDARRTAHLETLGYTVLRFTNAEIMTNLEGVLTTIQNALQPPLPGPLP
jgi:very-short-patch-repair endonuclease